MALAAQQEIQTDRPLPSAIKVTDITVAYRAYTRKTTSLKETVLRLFQRSKTPTFRMFEALSHVSLEVKKGSVLGLIGSNGCGKSTLLKVIAGVLPPTQGSVRTTGEISSLIELGAGFDPELTAIENIYLNGSLHKKTRAEMASRVQHILDFAELHEFATTPIKYYSSGMFARLGFSVAVDVDPEILLVDEILSVGDERFQKKCGSVFEKFLKEQKTIVLVTHDMSLIEARATHVALLEKGRIVYFGDPQKAIAMYREGGYQAALI